MRHSPSKGNLLYTSNQECQRPVLQSCQIHPNNNHRLALQQQQQHHQQLQQQQQHLIKDCDYNLYNQSSLLKEPTSTWEDRSLGGQNYHQHYGQTIPYNTNNSTHLSEHPGDVVGLSAPRDAKPSHDMSMQVDEEECEEDDNVDEEDDETSDFEEEERLREMYNQHKASYGRMSRNRNRTSTLLCFSENVTSELQRYLSRTKDQDESCDIYEDKWATTKSGRELYYADLLRIVHGDSEPLGKSKSSSSNSNTKGSKAIQSSSSSYTPQSSSSGSSSPAADTVSSQGQFRGVREASLGLGPLEELFDVGLKTFTSSEQQQHQQHQPMPNFHSSEYQSKHTNPNTDNGGMSSPFQDERAVVIGNRSAIASPAWVPMHARQFPESFWKEPKSLVNTKYPLYSRRVDIAHIATQKLPDFTDLMESWHGGDADLAPHDEKKRDTRLTVEAAMDFTPSLQSL